GDFWVGTPEGALHFDGSPDLATSGQELIQYTTADGLAHNSVEAIAIAPDGTLWFGTYHGASRFDGSPELTTSGQNWTTVDQLAGKRIRDIAVAPDGALWFATDTGIHRYAPETTTTMEPSPSPIFTPIPTHTPTITPYPTRTPIPTQTPTPSPTPTPLPAIFQQIIPIEEVLPGDFERLHTSSDGTLWLITDEGIARMQEGIWSTYLEDSTAGLVGIDGDGRAWVVSEDTGQISAWDGTTWTVYGDDEGWLPVPLDDGWHREVKWGESDGAGGFWIATSRDVRFFDGEQWTIYTPEEMNMDEVGREELLAAFTLKIAKRSGTVWVGECDWAPPGPTGGQGLRWFDSSTDLTTGGQGWHGDDAPTASGCVATIAEDKAGHVWAGVGANLWRFDPVSGEAPEFGVQTQFEPPDEPPVGWQRYGSINQITLDPTGDPWVTMLLCGGACCDNLVLYHIHNGTWTPIGEVGLPIGAFIDVAGTSWYIGSSGVQRVAGTALEMVVPLRVRSVVVDEAERVWFVARYRGALWLWVLDGKGG
ncbi:MAG: ligand-binding sensor domain-containing protein, partial [Anaerolineae bacterium]